MDVNSKAFTLLKRTTKSFNIFISNFAFAITFLFRIKNKIKLTFVLSFILNAIQTINVKRISIVIAVVKLRTTITQIMTVKKIKISFLLRQTMKSIVLIKKKISIGFTSKAIQKMSSSLSVKKIKIISSILLGTFTPLGTHDPSTLGTLDSSTLGSMDGSFS